MKVLPALLLGTALLAGVAQASDGTGQSLDATPSAGAMAFDAVVVRPLGLASLVIGSVLFVAQLPFDIAVEGGAKAPFQKLVAEPAKFTFARPLGSLE